MSCIKKLQNNELTSEEYEFIKTALLKEKKKNTSHNLLDNYLDKLIDIWVDAFRNNKVISEKDRNIVRESLALMKQSENLYNQKWS